MKAHPQLGHDIVCAAERPSEAHWILHHHERIDGTGYPDGLAGDDIPLESRIILVADAFEAITADRPYRAAPRRWTRRSRSCERAHGHAVRRRVRRPPCARSCTRSEQRGGVDPRSQAADPEPPDRLAQMAGRTQAALYAEIDHELSWSEDELPERERTKHVHRLHPYLGQVRAPAGRGAAAPPLRPGSADLRPVRRLRHDAGRGERAGHGRGRLPTSRRSTACSAGQDRRATTPTRAEPRAGAGAGAAAARRRAARLARALVRARGAGRADRVPRGASAGSARSRRARVVLSRAARSARRVPTTTSTTRARPVTGALLVPQAPPRVPPGRQAARFLRRYAADTVRRLASTPASAATCACAVLHADARAAGAARPASTASSPLRPTPG